jgi:pimeloyl-ACP methyl ester carboxylesterase
LALNRYNTETLVTDLESLRQALGYERWNLFGESYSTRLILLAMDAYPSAIRSAILDSVHPTTVNVYESAAGNFVRALETFFEQCESNPDCGKNYPELGPRFYSLIEALNSNPVSVVFANRDTGQDSEATVDGNWLLAQSYDVLYGHLNQEGPLAYWPLLIDQLSRGNFELLEPWVAEGVIDWESTLAFGMYFSVMCQDEFAVARPQLLAEGAAAYPELVGWANNALGRSVCEAWDLESSPPWAGRPVESDIPTLILSGSHAPVTNPAWGDAAAETLSNSFSFEFSGMGQWVSAASPCAQRIITDFLDDPTSEPDAACLETHTDFQIVLPGDIAIEAGITRYFIDIHSQHPDLFRQVALGASLLLFAGQLAFLCLAIFRPLIRGRTALAAQLLAGLAALLNLGFGIALVPIVEELAIARPLVLRFGLPDGYRLLLVVPVLTNILAAAVMVIAFLIWIKGSWSKGQRLFYSLVALGAVTFSSLMAYWGFLLLP